MPCQATSEPSLGSPIPPISGKVGYVWEVLPWAEGDGRPVDALVMPSCSQRCHGGQGGKRITGVPLTRARVNPRPSSCVTFLFIVELRASWGV